ncbi:DH domain containing protein [Rhodotorula toruloides]|uniref:DH domain containing protein n=1 Tax=Rhodotorula toruloides TaxID=5286 RepID=A0A511KQL3_RHOTO|nr:DH domain containing protein [Rhodotorula toruloides]
MLKFWKSKAKSPQQPAQFSKSPSPAPSDPPKRPSTPSHALHGLGLSVPPSEGTSTSSRRDFGSSTAPSFDSFRLSPEPLAAGSSVGHGGERGLDVSDGDGKSRRGSDQSVHGNVLREKSVNVHGREPCPGGLKVPYGRSERAASPASFATTVSMMHSRYPTPYGAENGGFPDSDPTQIHAPTTWSEMAHRELVANLSPRERTRQEILWEVVASEERYVAELRSLVDLYTHPLLHPLLSKSSSPHTSPNLSLSPTLSRPSPQLSASPSPDLPIASRFSRSMLRLSSPTPEDENDSSEIWHGPNTSGPLSLSPIPSLPTGARQNASHTSLDKPRAQSLSDRVASFGSRTRHPLRPQPSATKLQKSASKAPPEILPPPLLPDALKQVLEATVEMLKGHEELSARLKEQWARAFPLVRGLAAIWSDQPWFLQTYASYIVALEEALAILDNCLPSSHSPSLSSYASRFKSPKTAAEKETKRLDKVLMRLEEQAAAAGESSLSICLSKPLMRLSKLPLLMQALLYHTDPTTHEWEKTRAMALEVDALVRSIEDEKLEEEEREKTRDALARIDGIRHKALMAPRSARILIEEVPAPDARTRRRLSAPTVRRGKTEWLIRFTDVVIRAEKTGETDIPGSFSRQKEKKGKQGKPRRTGKLRNTYRFVSVERWEPREMADLALHDLNELRRLKNEGSGPPSEDGEMTDSIAESRMSFRYDTDEPQPARRDFASLRSPPAAPSAKFGHRLRIGTEGPPGARSPPPNQPRYDSPTVSSALKAQPVRGLVSAENGARQEAQVGRSLAHARDDSTFALYSIWSSAQE